IRHSTQATDFITPKGAASQTFRDAVLTLARTQPFARSLVNSGRLSRPAMLAGSPLLTPDDDAFRGPMAPGTPCIDAPAAAAGRASWLLHHLATGRFALLYHADADAVPSDLAAAAQALGIDLVAIGEPASGILGDSKGLVAGRYDLRPGTLYLIRPDQ